MTNSNEADSADANAKIGFRFEYWTIPCPCENDAECTGDVDRCDRFAKKKLFCNRIAMHCMINLQYLHFEF